MSFCLIETDILNCRFVLKDDNTHFTISPSTGYDYEATGKNHEKGGKERD